MPKKNSCVSMNILIFFNAVNVSALKSMKGLILKENICEEY